MIRFELDRYVGRTKNASLILWLLLSFSFRCDLCLSLYTLYFTLVLLGNCNHVTIIRTSIT